MELNIVCYENAEKKTTYLGIEFTFGDGRKIKVFPKEQNQFCDILDLKPSELHSLPVGIVKSYKEVK